MLYVTFQHTQREVDKQRGSGPTLPAGGLQREPCVCRKHHLELLDGVRVGPQRLDRGATRLGEGSRAQSSHASHDVKH